jgi:hypothetical protein
VTDVTHRYHVGDQVVFHPPPTLPEFAGAYSIERLLPISETGPNYLIKRLKDDHERSASEREITPPLPPTFPKSSRIVRKARDRVVRAKRSR